MLYLSGSSNNTILPDLCRMGVGLMAQPATGYTAHIPSFAFWAADNGCFAQGERFDMGMWLKWLDGLRIYQSTCLFAVAPDVVGDAAATIRRSLPVLPRLRDMGYKAAFVAQDGLERLAVPWDELDCLFVGGTTMWKLGLEAAGLVRAAKQSGKWVHAGRVNSLRRLQWFAAHGADSADGTFLAFGPDVNLPRVQGWMDALKDGTQGALTWRA